MSVDQKPYMILVQDARASDEALWWGRNRSGYTTDFDKAGRYTEDEYLEAVPRSKRKTHVLVRLQDILPAVQRVVPLRGADRAREATLDAAAACALRFLTARDGYDRIDVIALETLQFSNDRERVHLVRYTHHGTPGPTLCGVDRFSTDPGRPGWSLGGGVTGPNVVHVPCDGCADEARHAYPGVPVKGPVGGREMATHLGVALVDHKLKDGRWTLAPR